MKIFEWIKIKMMTKHLIKAGIRYFSIYSNSIQQKMSTAWTFAIAMPFVKCILVCVRVCVWSKNLGSSSFVTECHFIFFYFRVFSVRLSHCRCGCLSELLPLHFGMKIYDDWKMCCSFALGNTDVFVCVLFDTGAHVGLCIAWIVMSEYFTFFMQLEFKCARLVIFTNFVGEYFNSPHVTEWISHIRTLRPFVVFLFLNILVPTSTSPICVACWRSYQKPKESKHVMFRIHIRDGKQFFG